MAIRAHGHGELPSEASKVSSDDSRGCQRGNQYASEASVASGNARSRLAMHFSNISALSMGSGHSDGQNLVTTAHIKEAVAQRFGSDVISPRTLSGVSRNSLTARFVEVSMDRANSDNSLHVSHDRNYYVRVVSRVLRDANTEFFLVGIILADICFSCIDVDRRAGGQDAPKWVEYAINVCFCVYVVELLAIIVVKRWRILCSMWSLIDLAIILFGTADILVTSFAPYARTEVASALRFSRLLRLFRIIRKLNVVKDVQRILKMAASCGRMLGTTFAFVTILMTLWGLLAVELMHPLAKQLIAEDVWQDNRLNEGQLSSVMRANLLLFQTVVANDAWGEVALPMIVRFPWTVIMFVGIYLILIFGFINLMAAAAVDVFMERRQKDVTLMASEMDENQEQDMRSLRKIFTKLDEDKSGELSFEEVTEGIKTIPEFRHRLRVMDIDQADLHQLFMMLDEDGSGSVEPEEFIYFLNRWMQESRTADRFAKYNSMLVLERQERFEENMTKTLQNFGEQVQKLENRLTSFSTNPFDLPSSTNLKERSKSRSKNKRVQIEKEGRVENPRESEVSGAEESGEFVEDDATPETLQSPKVAATLMSSPSSPRSHASCNFSESSMSWRVISKQAHEHSLVAIENASKVLQDSLRKTGEIITAQLVAFVEESLQRSEITVLPEMPATHSSASPVLSCDKYLEDNSRDPADTKLVPGPIPKSAPSGTGFLVQVI